MTANPKTADSTTAKGTKTPPKHTIPDHPGHPLHHSGPSRTPQWVTVGNSVYHSGLQWETVYTTVDTMETQCVPQWTPWRHSVHHSGKQCTPQWETLPGPIPRVPTQGRHVCPYPITRVPPTPLPVHHHPVPPPLHYVLSHTTVDFARIGDKRVLGIPLSVHIRHRLTPYEPLAHHCTTVSLVTAPLCP